MYIDTSNKRAVNGMRVVCVGGGGGLGVLWGLGKATELKG